MKNEGEDYQFYFELHRGPAIIFWILYAVCPRSSMFSDVFLPIGGSVFSEDAAFFIVKGFFAALSGDMQSQSGALRP